MFFYLGIVAISDNDISSEIRRRIMLGQLCLLWALSTAEIRKTSRPHEMVVLHGDDAKLFLLIRNRSDQLRLQATLSAFQSWCSLNGLELCAEKCAPSGFCCEDL